MFYTKIKYKRHAFLFFNVLYDLPGLYETAQ